MEDFSTILWVVVFGAAMLFSAATKKNRKQQSGNTNPHEAWPTLFGDSENEERPQKSATAPQAGYDAERADGASLGKERGYSTQKKHSHEPHEQMMEKIRELFAGQETPEGQEIPEYKAYELPQTPLNDQIDAETMSLSSKFSKQAKFGGRPQEAASKTAENSLKYDDLDNDSPSDADGKYDSPEDAEITAEGFDLRKAVLYSEVLKPKFEE